MFLRPNLSAVRLVHSQVNSFQQLGPWRANLAYFPHLSLKKTPQNQLSQAVLVTFIHSICRAFKKPRAAEKLRAPGLACACACVRVCMHRLSGAAGSPPALAAESQIVSPRKKTQGMLFSNSLPACPPHSSRKAGFGAGFPASGSGPHLRSLFPGAPVTGTAARLRVRARARAGGEPGCGRCALPVNPRRAASQAGCAIRAVTRAGNRQRKRKKSPRQFAYRTRATPSRKLGEF